MQAMYCDARRVCKPCNVVHGAYSDRPRTAPAHANVYETRHTCERLRNTRDATSTRVVVRTRGTRLGGRSERAKNLDDRDGRDDSGAARRGEVD